MCQIVIWKSLVKGHCSNCRRLDLWFKGTCMELNWAPWLLSQPYFEYHLSLANLILFLFQVSFLIISVHIRILWMMLLPLPTHNTTSLIHFTPLVHVNDGSIKTGRLSNQGVVGIQWQKYCLVVETCHSWAGDRGRGSEFPSQGQEACLPLINDSNNYFKGWYLQNHVE